MTDFLAPGNEPELWLLLTCALLAAVWAAHALVLRVGRYRSLFRHARRCEAAREQMRREAGGLR